VIDANILFAILIKEGITEKIMFSDNIHLYAPEYLFTEFQKHEKEILEITQRSQTDFSRLIGVLERRIDLVPFSKFCDFFEEAKTLLDDKNDAAYLAVCIAKQMPLWSNDRGFKKQNRVEIFTTEDIIRKLDLA